MKENSPKTSSADLMAALNEAFNPNPSALPALPPATDGTDDETLELAPGAPPELEALRNHQRRALDILTQGGSYTEAASHANVSRRTLYTWVNKDPLFQAALQAWRDRVTRHAQDRLTQAVNVAAQTLGRAAARDVRAAVILLKGQGLLNGQRPGASQGKAADPAEAALAELRALPPSKRQAVELRLRELILSFREEPETKPVPTITATSAPGHAGQPSLDAPQLQPTHDDAPPPAPPQDANVPRQ